MTASHLFPFRGKLGLFKARGPFGLAGALAGLLVGFAAGVTALGWLDRKAVPDPPSMQRLTLPETLGAVFVRLHHGEPWAYYVNADPAARDPLRRVLDRPELEMYHPCAWRMLGYIGDAEDLHRLETAIGHMEGPVTPESRASLYAMFDCLGLMTRRGIPEAQAVAQRMAAPDYWANAKFTWGYGPNDSYTDEWYTLGSLLDGYALSGREEVRASLAPRVEVIENAKLKEYMRWRVSKERLAEFSQRVNAADAIPVPTDARTDLVNRFNGDLVEPAPAIAPARPSPPPRASKNVRRNGNAPIGGSQ